MGIRAEQAVRATWRWNHGRWRLAGLVAAVLAGLATAPSAEAAPCDTPANEIVAENCKAGTPPSVWQIPGSGDESIQGFATDISVDQGQTVRFKIDTTASAYRVDLYRLGWYDGDGARKVATLQPSQVLDQGSCATDGSTGLIDCSNWSESASWVVPQDATSGIYLAHLVAEAGVQGESHIPFVVRDDDGRSDLLFQTSDTTWQAYNRYGGNSLYTGSPAGRAYKVSYNRPFTTASDAEEDWIFNSEFPMVRWLERNGFDVSYFTGVDSDRLGAEIRDHKAFLSVGHDEYWSGDQRTNVEAARDAGVNLAFFSGNEVFWKTRWENDHRTLVSYKETHATTSIDPTSTWTGTWRDPRPFNPEGAEPENALTGTAFLVNSGTRAIEVPAADGKMRFWRGTLAANLAPTDTATLPDGTLGYEWDTDPDNGVRPSGLVRLSSTTAEGLDILKDYGSTYGPGGATHHLTLYRDTNGAGPDALVLGAGTVQWSWGLDLTHVRGGEPPSPVMQQATTNLLADMGVQPATLQAGLQPASPSTDTIAPSATITSAATISVTAGTPQTVQGIATDTGGGVVGAVEVSVDAGATWHAATGRETWSYTWTPILGGPVTPLARAADDSGNLTGADQSTPPPGSDPPPGGGDPPPSDPAPPAGSGGGPGTPGTGAQGTQPGVPGGASAPATSRDAPVTPAVDISPSTVRMSRDGAVRLRIACPRGGGDCRVELRLRLDGRPIAHRTFNVEAGDARRVALKLDRAARRKLIRKRSLRVTAVATVAGGRTNRTTIRLLAPGPVERRS
jgi:hypothetical protein